MTKLWLPVRRWVFLGIAILIMLLVLLPLRLGAGVVGLDRMGFSARQMEGVIWSGEVGDAQVGPLPLGRLHLSLNPLPLLIGEGRMAFTGRPRATAPTETGLSGVATGSRNSYGVERVGGSIDAGALVGGLPVGLVTLTDFAARWESGQCAEASGRVRADLSGPVAGLPLGSLSGAPRCDGATLLLALASATGAERLDVRLTPGGASASLVVTQVDPTLVPALTGAGFVQGAGGYTLALPIGSVR